MSLRVYPQAKVELVLPRRASEFAGAAFLQAKQQWIERVVSSQKKRDAVQKPILCADGASISCFGDSLTLSLIYRADRKRSTVEVRGASLVVHAKNLQAAQRALKTWYQKEALSYFIGQAQEYAQVLGVSIATIRAIDMKTQWGSCNKRSRALTFNWKLALGPEEIARYVVAHEVAHLVEANHSKAFWSVVRKIDPGYATHKKWLKEFGGGLTII